MKSKRQIIALNKLYEHPNNPRKQIDSSELADNIRENGLLSPLLVRSWGDGYQIISGHRRKAAIAKLGLIEASCDVVEMDDEQTFKALMSANILTHSLSEIEEAEGIRQMMEQFKWSQERVSKEFGKGQDWVSRRIKLLDLSEPVKDLVMARAINPAQARYIAQLPTEEQKNAANKVVKDDLSSRETEQLVKVLKDDNISPELKQKAVETNISPETIKKMAFKEEIRQGAREARHEILAEHEAAGTVPPVPTDQELKDRRRAEKLNPFFQDLRDANLLLQPDPKMLPLLIEFKRTAEATNHLDFIIETTNKLKRDIAAALKEHNKPPIKLAGNKVIDFKGK